MAASFALRPLRSLVLLLVTLFAPALLAQVDNVYVYGTVKDYVSSKKLDGVAVTVYKNGGKLAEVVTSASGKYEFNLDYGSEYKLVYSKSGVVSKNITIDTRNIPEEERVGGHGMNVEMTLFSELPGIDFSVLQQPIGKAHFDPTTKEVTWDLQYTEQIKAEITRLMKEYDDKKKREANAEEDFNKLMAQGDAAMTSADYNKAVESFTGALALKAGDAKATARLSDAKMKLDDLNGEKKRGEQYAALIKDADGLFGKKDYEGAKGKYKQALDLKEEEPYPKQKLKECDTLLDELAKQAEADRKKKELDDKYNAAIAAGDAMMKGEKYEDAQARYTDASALKPAEKYPKDQIALITTKLAELAKKAEEERKAKEAEAKYQATIVAADAAFNAANYDQAKTKYNEALGMKPAEKYPKDQLAAIVKKQDELAKMAEDARKQKEIDDAYNTAIAAADAAFHAEKFDVARTQYTAALAVKAKEKYPQDQLAAIDKRIAELAKQADEARKKKELDANYNAAIAAADAAFHGAKWDEAKAKYTEALSMKAQEQYPKDQLAAIDKTIADAAKKAEDEKKQQELEAQYQKLLADADKLFGLNKLADSRAKYTEASAVKPEESRPKERIAEIDAKLADQAREAEEERKQKELDAKYNALIAKADKEFDTEKFPDALNDYKDALGLKADEQHPKDRIAEISQKLDADAQAKAEEERSAREKAEKDKEYADLIAKADGSFDGKSYDEAKSGYTEALAMRPDEKHPKDRLAEITKILADMAAKSEADRLKAEQDSTEQARLDAERRKKEAADADVEGRYREAVAKADLAFGQESFDNARDQYTSALSIKPEESYPKDRLAEIEKILADRQKALADAASAADEQRKLEEERKLKEAADAEAARLAAESDQERLAAEKAKEDQYLRTIAEADSTLGLKDYSAARDLYTMSLDMKPQEVYPQSKIEQIDKLLAELERQRQEAEAAAQKVKEPADVPKRENTSIDKKKEQEAEEFMREAREREELEKYERIKRLKAGVSSEDSSNTQESLARRNAALEKMHGTTENGGAGVYSGSDAERRKHEEELASLRTALDARSREVMERDTRDRGIAMAENEKHVTDASERDASLRAHQAEHGTTLAQQKEALQQATADVTHAKEARTGQALKEVENVEKKLDDIQKHGAAVNQGERDRVATGKEQQSAREQHVINRSQDARLAAKEKLDATSTNKPKTFADFSQSTLAKQYPEGVTEESKTVGNKIIVTRIVVHGNKADEFMKVISKESTTYFKNHQSISADTWERETSQ